MSFSNKKIKLISLNRCRELRKRQTPAEKVFWENVRNRKFKNLKFNRQYPLFYDILGTESFYIADFYCHSEKLVVEIDGDIHRYQKEKDKLRTEIINMLGIKVLRFKNNEVLKDTEKVLEKLTIFIYSK